MSQQVSVEKLDGLKRRLSITTSTKDLKPKIDGKIKDAAKNAKMPGFRAGKVPVSMLRERYEGQFVNDELNVIIDTAFRDAVEKEKLEFAGVLEIKPNDFKLGDEELNFDATIEVMPELKGISIDGAKLDVLESDVADSDIDETLKKLQQQHATWKEVDRKAANDDRVTIDFVGSIDGEEFDGGKGEDMPIVLGSGSMIPGFEEGLIGVKPGASKKLKVTFPEKYHAEHLAGKKAVFETTVKKIEEAELPTLDEEFAKTLGNNEGTVESLKDEIKKNLSRELKNVIKTKNKTAALDALVEKNKFDVPESLIQNEAVRMQQEMHKRQGGKGELPDVELFKEQAKKNVTLGLLVSTFIKEQELVVDQAKVDEAIDEIAVSYQMPEEVKTYYQNPEMRQQIENGVLEDMAIEKMLETAKTKVKKLNYQEAMKG